MNTIWLFFMCIGVSVSFIVGDPVLVTRAIHEGSQQAVQTALGLIGIMSFWLGLMRVAEDAGLVRILARLIRPLVTWMFPEVPKDHPAMGTILLNVSVNILGLGNAATPLGLKAMAQLQELNPKRDTATDSMCTLLALNTSSITLIPTMVIAVRAAAGSVNPMEIVGTTIFATSCSTLVALSVDSYYRRRHRLHVGGRR